MATSFFYIYIDIYKLTERPVLLLNFILRACKWMFLEAEWVEREKWAIETKSIWHISTSSGIQLFKILFTGKNLFYDTFPIALVGFVKLILTIFQKKTEKFWPFFSFFSFFWGGVRKEANLYFGKIFFQWACRIILGPPKHVLHLVWSAYIISTAIRAALKIARRSQILGKRRPVLKRKFDCFWNGTKRKICFSH